MKKILGIIGGVICMFLLIAGVYQMGRLAGKNESGNFAESDVNMQGGSEEAVSSDAPVSQTENVEAAGNKAAAAEEETGVQRAAGDAVDVSYAISSSWDGDSGKYSNIEATLTNRSDADINGWALELTVPKGAKLDQFWNGECEIKSEKLLVSPMDYNALIEAGKSVSFGFIIITPSSFKPAKTVITAGGNTYGSAGDDSTGVESNEKDSKNDGSKDKSDSEDGTEDAGVEGEAVKAAVKGAVKKHGRLRVKGRYLVDKNGKRVRLKGVSTHGIAWFPQYVNKKAFRTLKDRMGVNLIRLALYSDPGAGYTRKQYKNIYKGVKYATELGMYVIIDWHILSDGNPKTHQKEALHFFRLMSKKYKKHKNVFYEICNEPNGNVTWNGDVKPYAKKILKAIRKNDKKAVVIVGSPTWSQDVDVAAKSPLQGKNIMYSLHFYAATHKQDLRNKAQAAIKAGLPLFVTEFSICEASGAGTIDKKEGNRWMSFLKKNSISCSIWSLCNKDEAASLLKPSCNKTSGWKNSDLSVVGKWYKKK